MAGGLSARPRRLRAGLGLAALAGALVIAGCSGSGSGEGNATSATVASSPTTVTASPAETTTTASPTETSALPPLPEAAKENTPEGAEAFIRYYFDVANGLYQDPPSVDEIDDIVDEELVDPECISCDTLRAELKQLSENGQRTTGDLYTIESMERIGGGAPDVQRFNTTLTLENHAIETIETNERAEYSGGSVSGIGAALWNGTRWVIYDLELS